MKQKNQTPIRLCNGDHVFATRCKNGATSVLVQSGTKFVRKIYKNGSAKTDSAFALCASSAALVGGILVFAREKKITTQGEEIWT